MISYGQIRIGGNWVERHVDMLYNVLNSSSGVDSFFDREELSKSKVCFFEWNDDVKQRPLTLWLNRHLHDAEPVKQYSYHGERLEDDLEGVHLQSEIIKNDLSVCFTYIEDSLDELCGTCVERFTIKPQAEELAYTDNENLYYYCQFSQDVLEKINLDDDFGTIDKILSAHDDSGDQGLNREQKEYKHFMIDELDVSEDDELLKKAISMLSCTDTEKRREILATLIGDAMDTLC